MAPDRPVYQATRLAKGEKRGEREYEPQRREVPRGHRTEQLLAIHSATVIAPLAGALSVSAEPDESASGSSSGPRSACP